MPVCWPQYWASRSVVQLAVSCPTSWGSISITRNSSARPRGRDCSLSAWGGAPWYGIQSCRQVAFEHTLHGVLTAQHSVGDLARRLASQREQQHLVARARFGIGAFPRLDGEVRLASLHPLEAGLEVWSSLVPYFDLPLFTL
jgi:hypothetical protein